MIPVEQFAGRTSRIAGYAAALRDLDQAWAGLQVRFDEAASAVEAAHARGVPVEDRLSNMQALHSALETVEQETIALLSRLRAELSQTEATS